MNFEVDSVDVVRLVLQFLKAERNSHKVLAVFRCAPHLCIPRAHYVGCAAKENNLLETMRTLQAESTVSLNTVDSMDTFLGDIQNGRWELVLPQVATLKLPQDKVTDLYEQIVLEMIELGEKELAKQMLRHTDPLIQLKTEEPERYLKLESFAQRPYFNAIDANKERRREEIAQALVVEVDVVEPSRLLKLIGDALKWQYSRGELLEGQHYDLFKGGTRSQRRESEEKVPRKQAGQIKFPKESHPETCGFSPDGQYLVTGSVDGFVEVWDFDRCKLRKDLEYQANDEIMMHDEPVLCCSFSREGEFLATGSQDGKVKVWKISTGKCVRKVPKAHSEGITSVAFHRDASHILTTSFDATARIHGLKSGKKLKEFRGHTSYVNSGVFTLDCQKAVTGSSDGTVRVWDVKTAECLIQFRPGVQLGVAVAIDTGVRVHTIQMIPGQPDHIFVSNRSSTVYIMNLHGIVVKSFSSGKVQGGDFVCATLSPQGKWIYCVGEDRELYVFNTQSGQLDHVMNIATEGDVIAVSHHPHRSLLATVTSDGVLKTWKP